jgi:hypothetical protein
VCRGETDVTASSETAALFTVRPAPGGVAALLPCARSIGMLEVDPPTMETRMTKRFFALLLGAMLATGTAACNDNAEDHVDEAADARQEAAQEMSEGDTADAREEMQDAARHDSAAATDASQGDNTEGVN